MLRPLLLAALCLAGGLGAARGCQLPSEWRPLSEGCRAELAEIIVYAKVLALHEEVHGLYNYLPWQYEASDAGLFYSAEIEMLCDQAWGSMLEVPAGSRLNLTGLGYFSCHSHTVVQDYSYFFFLRMDENYNLLPHGVNFQDAIFPDTQENRRMFSSLFQFSNCSQGQQLATFSSDWEVQEDTRVWYGMSKTTWSAGPERESERKMHELQGSLKPVPDLTATGSQTDLGQDFARATWNPVPTLQRPFLLLCSLPTCKSLNLILFQPASLHSLRALLHARC
ncbi:coiled-coil domain-containing protein 3 isoform X2 [Bubalus bubalis]|uniref:coiled-coil domain-containing protein 3 isoform X2 n=1 Tax=Bubalus bubalis TaxID=89462 RepID=UPI001E1B7E89|nr:coiled-coil domain-containing protein 3 isoform X2 [Bubalus bubalis]